MERNGPNQFRALTLRLTTDLSDPAKALKQAAEEEEMGPLLRGLAAECTSVMPDRRAFRADRGRGRGG